MVKEYDAACRNANRKIGSNITVHVLRFLLKAFCNKLIVRRGSKTSGASATHSKYKLVVLAVLV